MHKRILLVTALLFSCFIVTAQDDMDSSKDGDNGESAANIVGIQKVKDSIFMIKGRGGNIAISVGEDGIFMVDNKFAETTSGVMQRIRSVSDKPIELLINTHHHGDHVGGNSYMSDLGTIIFSHDNARRRMSDPYTKPARQSHQRKIDSIIKLSGDKITNDESSKDAYRNAEKIVGNVEDMIDIPQGALPVVTFPKDLNFYYNGERIMIYHIPSSHTDGDVMVYFSKSNVIHSGDAFVKNTYPFIDTDNRGSLNGYIKGLSRLMSMTNSETKIIPGHGEVASKADIKYTQVMFRYLTEQISYHIVDKKSVEEVLAMNLTKEFDDKGFGEGFITTEKFVRTLYAELYLKHGKRK